MAFAQVDAGFRPVVSDNQFKEVIAQRDDLTVIDGGRMVPPTAETSYYAGQLLSQVNTGANAGLWVAFDPANSSATDGSQNPAGVLYAGADVQADGYGSEIRIITRGIVFADLCIAGPVTAPVQGVTQAQATAMGGKFKFVHGQRLLVF